MRRVSGCLIALGYILWENACSFQGWQQNCRICRTNMIREEITVDIKMAVIFVRLCQQTDF